MTGKGLLMAAAVLTLALSGCAGLTAEAELTYEGAQNGSHSDRADCDADGQIQGSGSITDGAVIVRVMDGTGGEMFERTFRGSFDLEETRLDGDAGEWRLEAVRGGDDILGDEFNGEYEFFLDCTGASLP